MLSLNAYAFSYQIWIRRGDQVLACYRAHPTQKYPYIYPVSGPITGIPVTTESGYQYPHHRSLLFACDRISGGNFWQEGNERGQIISRGPTLAQTEGSRIIWHDVCDWRLPGHEPVVMDERQFEICMPAEDLILIDAYFRVTAVQDIHIGRTNHSLFAVRVAPDLAPNGGGTLVNAEGIEGESATFGQTSAWCCFYAQRGDVIEGLTLMDHPDNPWISRWFTRDYGFASPTPVYWLGDAGHDLANGTVITAKYRVAVHTGAPADANIQGIYASWVG